jgi:urease gamma subunit
MPDQLYRLEVVAGNMLKTARLAREKLNEFIQLNEKSVALWQEDSIDTEKIGHSINEMMDKFKEVERVLLGYNAD